MEKSKMTGEEMRLLVLMRCMWGAIGGRAEKVLKKRLQSTPHGYKMCRQAYGLLSRMFDEVKETIPERQIIQIDNTIRNGEIGVRLRRAGTYDDDMTCVRAQPLETVVACAMRAECAICIKNTADIKRCALRRAIDELTPPDDYETHTCVYRDIAFDGAYPGGSD